MKTGKLSLPSEVLSRVVLFAATAPYIRRDEEIRGFKDSPHLEDVELPPHVYAWAYVYEFHVETVVIVGGHEVQLSQRWSKASPRYCLNAVLCSRDEIQRSTADSEAWRSLTAKWGHRCTLDVDRCELCRKERAEMASVSHGAQDRMRMRTCCGTWEFFNPDEQTVVLGSTAPIAFADQVIAQTRERHRIEEWPEGSLFVFDESGVLSSQRADIPYVYSTAPNGATKIVPSHAPIRHEFEVTTQNEPMPPGTWKVLYRAHEAIEGSQNGRAVFIAERVE